MSDQTSIFNNENDPSTQTPPNGTTSNSTNVQTDDSIATMLKEIKNERGEPKYKDPHEALKALQHSQSYIPELKSQLQEKERALEAALEQAKRAEELERTLAELTKKPDSETNTKTVELDESKIAELVQTTLKKAKDQETQKQNLDMVVATLQREFGADAENTFYSKGKELGMTVAELNSLAASKPKAVLTMFGIGEKQTKMTNTKTSTINTSAFQPEKKSAIGRSEKRTLIGATTEEMRENFNEAKAMAEELHAQGYSVYDLTDPKVYAKLFK